MMQAAERSRLPGFSYVQQDDSRLFMLPGRPLCTLAAHVLPNKLQSSTWCQISLGLKQSCLDPCRNERQEDVGALVSKLGHSHDSRVQAHAAHALARAITPDQPGVARSVLQAGGAEVSPRITWPPCPG